MYFRVKRTGPYAYLQIVRSHRDGGRVRQQVLSTLGRLDVLQATGQLDRLLRSGLRHCDTIRVLDAHAAGETGAVSIRSLGPDLVFGRLWEETGMAAIHKELLKDRRFTFDVERAVYLTVLHRLFASGSDRAAERWREEYAIPGTEALDLHHLYRAMEWLGEPLEKEESIPGSPRCTKDRIEEALFDRDRNLFSGADVVFFDTTSIYFEGEGGQTLGRHGHSKDSRPDLKQMIVGIAMDATGKPLCCEMWPGNTADVKTLLPVVERMRKRFRIRQVGIVADRGMISEESIATMEACDPPVRYILGARMRRQKEVRDTVLQNRNRWTEVQAERKTSKDPSPLKVKEARVEGRRYIVCLNEEQRRKDAHDRQAIAEHLRKQIKQGAKSLVGNKGYRRYLKTTPGSAFQIDEEKLKQEARLDGLWVLRTNMDDPAETIARSYKMLWMVEDLIRTTKSVLETRPIYHKRDETIRGHVFCSFLALVLKVELERRMREKDMSWEWAEVIRGLNQLREVEATFKGKSYLLRSVLTGHAYQATKAVRVTIPPPLRERVSPDNVVPTT
jgi:transposase